MCTGSAPSSMHASIDQFLLLHAHAQHTDELAGGENQEATREKVSLAVELLHLQEDIEALGQRKKIITDQVREAEENNRLRTRGTYTSPPSGRPRFLHYRGTEINSSSFVLFSDMRFGQ